MCSHKLIRISEVWLRRVYPQLEEVLIETCALELRQVESYGLVIVRIFPQKLVSLQMILR
jgi:hypothetical protein